MSKMRIVVVGPSGFTGSHVCKELLHRGHRITGVSRNPSALGTHELYTPAPVDLAKVSVTALAQLFDGHEVLINCHGPHSTHHLSYSPFVEACRKILLAAIKANVGYVFQVGGTGSLKFRIAPGEGIPDDGPEYATGFDGDTIDSNSFWRLYHQTLAKNVAHCKYLDIILPPVGTLLQDYQKVTVAREKGDTLSDEQKACLAKFERYVDHEEPLPVVHFVRGCRVVLMFYEGRKDFRWTFMSPPPNYFPCSASGSYNVSQNTYAPMEADGVTFRGISALDIGVAIADEVQQQGRVGQHWTLSADVPNDGVVAPTYWRVPK